MLKRILIIPRQFSSRFKRPQESDFVNTFEQLGLPQKVLNHLKEFTAPSQIQSKSMKSLMDGQDMIAIAPTGSGKTLAFAIPALVKSAEINKNRHIRSVSTLIICPTRQLSNQITSAIRPIANQFGLRIANLFGGAPKRDQFYDAKMSQVIVATPGRLKDYLSFGNPDKLNNVQSLILDEADRMLDMGFEEQVKQIISQTPPSRQTALFSATWEKQIEGMASSYVKSDAVYVQIGSNTHSINPNITQQFKFTGFREAKQNMAKVISQANQKVLIFCNTKHQTRKLAFELNEMTNKTVNFITSDLDQHQRTSVMKKFRESENSVMIATDVASRGIDVKDIQLVINFGFPLNGADFIHRVGRTGRGGKSGKSLTYIFKGDSKVEKDLKFIAKLYSNEKLQVPPSLLNIIEQLGINIGFRSERGGSQRSGRFGQNRSKSYREQTLQPTKKSQDNSNNYSTNSERSKTQQYRSRHQQNNNYY